MPEEEAKLQQMYEDNLWNSNECINLSKKIGNDKKIVSNVENLKGILAEYIDIIDSNDEELINEIANDLKDKKNEIDTLELETKLSGKNDKGNAILEIHSGAGGTEACDWADMLYRMYIRWCEKKGYSYEVLDTLYGEEAGIKKVIILVKGLNAYGYLKCERGVHRLVRLSPFDSANRRHTSFAAVEVTPQIDDDINIDVKDSDIRIDVYRSSGAGGQGVNTTDSAVRITHLPTNIVVTCQNERSQLKNKEIAMKILKSKLYAMEEEKRLKESQEAKNNQSEINFGSQIRSYVMHPYSMVKDHRTNYETSNVNKVLDGYIDEFIEEYLKLK
jgi:peptide chain release factor 2